MGQGFEEGVLPPVFFFFFFLRGWGRGARDSAVGGDERGEGKVGLGVAWVKLAWGWRPQQVLLPGA